VNYDYSLVVTITVTSDSWTPSSGDHLFACGVHLPAATSLPSPLTYKFYHFYPYFNSQFTSSTLPFGSRRSEGLTKRGLWPFSQVPYWAPFVVVDCITLNY